jgi:hypothetical protein
MLNRKKQTLEEKKARDKAYREAHREEIRAQQKAYYEAHREEIRAQQKAYYEAHREEIRAQKKAYRERAKREREEGLMDAPRQKRQRINPINDPIAANNELNLGLSFTEETRLNMVDSIFEAFDRIEIESNLPNQSIDVSSQQVIVPQLSSHDLLFGNTVKTNRSVSPTQEQIHPNTEEHANSNIALINAPVGNGNNNNFYRNSLSSRQLLFGDKTQRVSLEPQEIGRARLPSEKEREDYFVNSLFNL